MSTEQNAVVRIEAPQSMALSTADMEDQLALYTERRTSFRAWLESHMTPDVHYGYPPGISSADKAGWKARPSLYKAGADLLVDLLKVRVEYTMDRDTWEMLGSKPGTICYVARIINTGAPFFKGHEIGAVLAEGRGAFVVGEKKMGENSSVKMAQKRAKVDAVLNLLGLADLFTQDIEESAPAANPKAAKDADAPEVKPRNQRPAKAEPVQTPGQRVLVAWAEAKGLTPSEATGQCRDWITAKLPAIGRTELPTKTAPLTDDDAEKLLVLISEGAI